MSRDFWSAVAITVDGRRVRRPLPPTDGGPGGLAAAVAIALVGIIAAVIASIH